MNRMMSPALVFICFFGIAAIANTNLGGEVKPVVQDGKPRVGLQYAPDFLALTLTLKANDLSMGAGAKVYAEFWDRVSDRPFSDLVWQKNIATATPAGTTYVVTAGLNGAAAQGPIARLKSMLLVLTVAVDTGAERKVFVDLGSLCTTNPDNFLNLNTGEQGCP